MIGKVFSWIRNNKKRIFLFTTAYMLFAFLLFPFQDLGHLVSTQVARLTQNQVYLKFDNLNLSMFPAPGVSLSNVKVQTQQLPAITASHLKLYPNILGLLALKPGFSAKASDIFGGDVSLSLRGGGKATSGAMRQNISLDSHNLLLKKLAEILQLSMNLDGYVSIDTSLDIDPSFSEQPSAVLELTGNRISISSAVVPTQFGPLNLPDTKLQELLIKATLGNGDLEIEKVQIGSKQDELFAQVRGQMKIQMRTVGNQVSVVPGAFDLVVQIVAKESFQSKAGVFLSFLDSYKKGNNEYIFRAQGSNFYAPPKMSAISSF